MFSIGIRKLGAKRIDLAGVQGGIPAFGADHRLGGYPVSLTRVLTVHHRHPFLQVTSATQAIHGSDSFVNFAG
jgi:hypothetical protein